MQALSPEACFQGLVSERVLFSFENGFRKSQTSKLPLESPVLTMVSVKCFLYLTVKINQGLLLQYHLHLQREKKNNDKRGNLGWLTST